MLVSQETGIVSGRHSLALRLKIVLQPFINYHARSRIISSLARACPLVGEIGVVAHVRCVMETAGNYDDSITCHPGVVAERTK